MERVVLATLCSFVITGCSSMGSTDSNPLGEYDAALMRGESGDLLEAAAMRDLDKAAQECWIVSNNYEKRAKNAEGWKLGLGAGGGVLGFVGAMLAAAGTGGAAGGITSGAAGVISTMLGTAESGPLGTAEFIQERDGTARHIITTMDEAATLTDAKTIKRKAVHLRNTCRAAVVSGVSKS